MCKDEIAFSGGAACNAGDIKPSHVLTAIGLTPQEASETFRIGFGRFNTEEEVDRAIEILSKKLV
jgi:cysteine desulfurase